MRREQLYGDIYRYVLEEGDDIIPKWLREQEERVKKEGLESCKLHFGKRFVRKNEDTLRMLLQNALTEGRIFGMEMSLDNQAKLQLEKPQEIILLQKTTKYHSFLRYKDYDVRLCGNMMSTTQTDIDKELKKNSFANIHNLAVGLFDRFEKNIGIVKYITMNEWTYGLFKKQQQMDDKEFKSIWGAEIIIDLDLKNYELVVGNEIV